MYSYYRNPAVRHPSPPHNHNSTPTRAQRPTTESTRPLKVGAGNERKALLGDPPAPNKAWAGAKWLAKGVAGLVVAPIALAIGVAYAGVRMIPFIGRMVSEKLLEPAIDTRFHQADAPWINKLAVPAGKESLALDATVVKKLIAHAKATGSPLSESRIKALVATGERLVQALDESPPAQRSPHSPLTVPINDRGIRIAMQIPSSIFTTRAICWYLMAKAAQEDAHRESGGQKKAGVDFPSAMVVEGSIRFKDPGCRLFEFLKAAPTTSMRASTHFKEAIAEPTMYRWAGVAKMQAHYGIEDPLSGLPGRGGALVFNRLASSDRTGIPEIYLKIEEVGCPPYLQFEEGLSVGEKAGRWFSSLDRNIAHSSNFLTSRFQTKTGDSAAQVYRQEHMHKGYLKSPLYDPFMKAVEAAAMMKLEGINPKAIAKELHKGGGFETIDRVLKCIDLRPSDQPASHDHYKKELGILVEMAKNASAEYQKKLQSPESQPGQAPEARGAEWRPVIFSVPVSPSPSVSIGQDMAGQGEEPAMTVIHLPPKRER